MNIHENARSAPRSRATLVSRVRTQAWTVAEAAEAAGSITRVNKAAGNVTIAHGPIAELHWPAMTMRFGVAGKKLFERLSPGKKVEFRFVHLGNDDIVTAVN